MSNFFNNYFKKQAPEANQAPVPMPEVNPAPAPVPAPAPMPAASKSNVTSAFVSIMKTTIITIFDIISTSSYAARFYEQLNILSPEGQQLVFTNCDEIIQDAITEQQRQLDQLRNQNDEQIQEERAARMLAILALDVSKKTIPKLVYGWFEIKKQLGSASNQMINTVKSMFSFKIFGGKRSGKTSKRKHRNSRRRV